MAQDSVDVHARIGRVGPCKRQRYLEPSHVHTQAYQPVAAFLSILGTLGLPSYNTLWWLWSYLDLGAVWSAKNPYTDCIETVKWQQEDADLREKHWCKLSCCSPRWNASNHVSLSFLELTSVARNSQISSKQLWQYRSLHFYLIKHLFS